MIATIQINSKKYQIDFSKPLDISISIKATKDGVNAWYQEPPIIEPFTNGNWIGKVSEGAPVNFNAISFNPHAHGTHTECVGHITKEFISVNQEMTQYFFLAEVITVALEKQKEDWIISKKQLQYALGNKKRKAVVIRTLPNTNEKKNRQYSYTNPPYLQEDAAEFLKEKGVEHLLVDLPSVDKEDDGGKLLAHKAFWNFNGTKRKHATITELIYVPNKIEDGTYFLDIQMAPFENDATPSKPILYAIL